MRPKAPSYITSPLQTFGMIYNTPQNKDTLNREHNAEIIGHVSEIWVKGQIMPCIILTIY